jgi:hypothetical protein
MWLTVRLKGMLREGSCVKMEESWLVGVVLWLAGYQAPAGFSQS